MADILSFAARLARTSGWSAFERARLRDLADRLAADGGVEVVFGASDAGDPWCVIKDAFEEVLVHVARIDGQFVVHHAADDILQEGEDLWSVLGGMLGVYVAEDPQGGVVIPFSLESRQAQTLIALVVVTAFYHESGEPFLLTQDEPASERAAQTAPEGPPEAAQSDDPKAPDDDAASVRAEPVGPQDEGRVPDANVGDPTAGGASAKPTAGARAAPESSGTELEVRQSESAIPAEPTGDTVIGGSGGDVIRGGEGADSLDGGGAGPGEIDWIDGGGGDDSIVLAERTIAVGGSGDDTFHVLDTAVTGDARPLGVVTDFFNGERDGLLFRPGLNVTVLERAEVADVTAGVPPMEGQSHSPVPGLRLTLDFNDDGKGDGYVLLGVQDASRTPGFTPTVVVGRGEGGGTLITGGPFVPPAPSPHAAASAEPHDRFEHDASSRGEPAAIVVTGVPSADLGGLVG
jgi:hypothetical protein